MSVDAVVVSILSSGVVSAIVSIVLLKGHEKWIEEKHRRLSVLFNDRYAVYKQLYALLLTIERHAFKLADLAAEGYWAEHFALISQIKVKLREMNAVTTENNLILDDAILRIIARIDDLANSYELLKEEDRPPEEASASPAYYVTLTDQSKEISKTIEVGRMEFKEVFLKKL
jgi:hypothetical protein